MKFVFFLTHGNKMNKIFKKFVKIKFILFEKLYSTLKKKDFKFKLH